MLTFGEDACNIYKNSSYYFWKPKSFKKLFSISSSPAFLTPATEPVSPGAHSPRDTSQCNVHNQCNVGFLSVSPTSTSQKKCNVSHV